MSDEQLEPTKIRKIKVNGKDYIDLHELIEQIKLLGISSLIKGQIFSAIAMDALVGTLKKEEIYDSYPKTNETKTSEGNLVSLFGDATKPSNTIKE